MSRAAEWEAVGRDWERTRPHALWRAHADRVTGGLLARWLPEPRLGRVLKTDAFDEAFGEGVAGALAARADEVWAIDVSPTTLARARARAPVRAVLADARRLPFADGAFDVAVSPSSLDHFDGLDELTAAIGELARVLRPGGRLVLTLDNPGNPAVALRNRLPGAWLRRIGLVPYPVGATLGRKALRAALAAAGFEVAALASTLHVPRAPAVLAAGLAERFGGPRAARAFLAGARAFERLAEGPAPFATGHFVAALAVRR